MNYTMFHKYSTSDIHVKDKFLGSYIDTRPKGALMINQPLIIDYYAKGHTLI